MAKLINGRSLTRTARRSDGTSIVIGGREHRTDAEGASPWKAIRRTRRSSSSGRDSRG